MLVDVAHKMSSSDYPSHIEPVMRLPTNSIEASASRARGLRGLGQTPVPELPHTRHKNAFAGGHSVVANCTQLYV